MPGPRGLFDMAVDRAVLIDGVMRAHLGLGIGEARQRDIGARHARIMEEENVDRCLATRIEVRRGTRDHREAHGATCSSMIRLSRRLMIVTPIRVRAPPITMRGVNSLPIKSTPARIVK